ncbi:MAG TPA: NADH-quinone oxidoreductase subunit A [bacterium]
MAVLPLMLARLVAPRKPGPSKRAAYECGMEPSGDSWIPFRIEYYVYALLFVVFDVEIAFMLPWALIWRGMGLIALVEMGLFILILAIGLAYAWRKGVLEWK